MANDIGNKAYQITLEQLQVLASIVSDLDAATFGASALVEEGHRTLEAILGDDRPLIYGEPE